MDIINCIRNDPDKIVIGAGGYGIVYASPKCPSYCVKVSNKKGTSCRTWSNEYNKVKQLLTHIKSTDHVEILTPLSYFEDGDECFMLTQRVMRRPYDPTIRQHTLQAQFGVKSCSLIHKGRGEFIGLKEIKSHLGLPNSNNNSNDTLIQYTKDLGKMMAHIHYLGKNDAYDIELWLGTTSIQQQPKLYIADFDLTETITDFTDKETLGRMLWSFDAVPYFPIPSVNQRLFKEFKEAYITTATYHGYATTAETIIQTYEDTNA
jgi:hypothetical protein